jgi:hypothetical protein
VLYCRRASFELVVAICLVTAVVSVAVVPVDIVRHIAPPCNAYAGSTAVPGVDRPDYAALDSGAHAVVGAMYCDIYPDC